LLITFDLSKFSEYVCDLRKLGESMCDLTNVGIYVLRKLEEYLRIEKISKVYL
jgi:hypothetical protein